MWDCCGSNFEVKHTLVEDILAFVFWLCGVILLLYIVSGLDNFGSVVVWIIMMLWNLFSCCYFGYEVYKRLRKKFRKVNWYFDR